MQSKCLIWRFRLYIFSLMSVVCIGLQSCQSVDEEKVKETVETFFDAYVDEDVNLAVSIYPNIINLKGKFRKSTSIDIDVKDIIAVSDTNIIVKFTHHWVNPFGADNTTRMRFYMQKRGERYQIVDSKNFCSYEDLQLYDFACKTGAIVLCRDTTDVMLSDQMTLAMPMLELAKTHVRLQIANGLTINKNWRWETSYYGDYASGSAVVTNNSQFPVESPKYEVVYYLSDDKTIVGADNGYVCYDIIMPGQSRSFSWFTSYVGNASRANLKVVFDDENWIDNLLENLPFDGSEFNKHCHGEDWWPK